MLKVRTMLHGQPGVPQTPLVLIKTAKAVQKHATASLLLMSPKPGQLSAVAYLYCLTPSSSLLMLLTWRITLSLPRWSRIRSSWAWGQAHNSVRLRGRSSIRLKHK